ncbi:MAG TPA: methyltransferase domain-containing protein [Acetobacteraceae bacterium]
MNVSAIRDWADAARRTPLSDGAALEAWHLLSPRCRFIKTLPTHAAVLDVGAGDGSLQIYRRWPAPKRTDLAMYTFALARGALFDQYQGYELGAWPQGKPDFGGTLFDAIVAANFIEHIDAPTDFIGWAASRLTRRGGIFLEWPAEVSLDLPTADELRAVGVDVMTGNYFDDATHRRELPQTKAVHDALRDAGLRIDEAGTVRLPFLHDHLMAIGKSEGDIVPRTLAYWSFTGWCQYVIARR